MSTLALKWSYDSKTDGLAYFISVCEWTTLSFYVKMSCFRKDTLGYYLASNFSYKFLWDSSGNRSTYQHYKWQISNGCLNNKQKVRLSKLTRKMVAVKTERLRDWWFNGGHGEGEEWERVRRGQMVFGGFYRSVFTDLFDWLWSVDKSVV